MILLLSVALHLPRFMRNRIRPPHQPFHPAYPSLPQEQKRNLNLPKQLGQQEAEVQRDGRHEAEADSGSEVPLQAPLREHILVALKHRIVGLGGDSSSPSFIAAMGEAKHALKAAGVRMEVTKRTASISTKREIRIIAFLVNIHPFLAREEEDDEDCNNLIDEKTSELMDGLKAKMMAAEEQYVQDLSAVVNILMTDVGLADS